MISPKGVLVVTTSGLDGLRIQKYLKPVSSHVVAGTNVFSDFAASFTDFFGGRSGTYQRQLSSLYNEAIERIKTAAFDIGANCVVGLKVDLDEISGKSKSMFMITVVGTAVIVDGLEQYQKSKTAEHNNGSVSLDKINTHLKKLEIVKNSGFSHWDVTDDVWDFITDNQVEEVFAQLVLKYSRINTGFDVEVTKAFYKKVLTYVNGFPQEKKSDMLYLNLLTAAEPQNIITLSQMISDLQMLDLKFVYNVLANDDIENKKKILQILAFQKPYYDKEDVADLQRIRQAIINIFKEQGTRSIKKGTLLAKEKAIWTCACGEVNDDDEQSIHCRKCAKDIYGFAAHQLSPPRAIDHVDRKIGLISHFL
ncbi:YbjQ family protein [Mucilaginibacter myungsuensis]|uniref:UPF0145 protein IRJ16_12835 n=1 Tax=Mucilaginibacter myungsuensis TaxID=649104 RepID=A0A929KX29_9SPHI|nr:YbjQ family protein [Mucilaginibacter myungsuensis]MBE9662772.1 YbjQ family protein [Mucilaginibacter myungsuensis]MDN3598192.1 YbjQ family protein [Mucilaginibacter myungsuensis]